jgi:hypothetical protein
MTTYSRVVKYVDNSGVTVYGPTVCGTGANEICRATGLFVDQAGSIYYSTPDYHRVLKFEQFATVASRVIGNNVNGGSQLNEFNYPGDIHVDDDGVLYVADRNN